VKNCRTNSVIIIAIIDSGEVLACGILCWFGADFGIDYNLL